MTEPLEAIARDPDPSLMARVATGDRQAFQRLVDRYWPRLVAYAGSIVASPDAAEDVVQKTFIRIWEHREKWQPTGSVSAYLYRIVRNTALNDERSARIRLHREHEAVGPGSEPAPSLSDPFDRARVRADVEQAIAALPERRREVFVLSRFHGLTHVEIAEALGISPQTVSNQMTSALAELRDALAHLLSEP